MANILNTIPNAPPASVAFSPPIVPTTLFATIVIIAIDTCVIKLEIPSFKSFPNTFVLILKLSFVNYKCNYLTNYCCNSCSLNS